MLQITSRRAGLKTSTLTKEGGASRGPRLRADAAQVVRSDFPREAVYFALKLNDHRAIVVDLRPLGRVQPRLEAGEALLRKRIALADLP